MSQSEAWRIVSEAVRTGALAPVENLRCVDCGEPAKHYDHRDYAKPLKVEAVCARCNARRGPGANKGVTNRIRSVPLMIWVSAEEKRIMSEYAAQQGLGLSTWIRYEGLKYARRILNGDSGADEMIP